MEIGISATVPVHPVAVEGESHRLARPRRPYRHCLQNRTARRADEWQRTAGDRLVALRTSGHRMVAQSPSGQLPMKHPMSLPSSLEEEAPTSPEVEDHLSSTPMSLAAATPEGVVYKRNISFVTSLFLVITTQVLRYGWAGLMRKYVVEPAHMWWPVSLVQVSLMRAMHEKEKRWMTRGKFFLIALICSFAWYTVPGYLFPTLTAVSWVCWVFPKLITMQQIGSGLNGLGIGAFTLDWSTVGSWLGSPLVTPFFATANVLIGYVLLAYIMLPVAYWVLNLYSASRYPLFSNKLFDASRQLYNIHNIVNDKFEIDMDAYAKQGRIHLSLFFAVSYGLGFATIAATLSHVTFFYGKEMYQRFQESYEGKMDVHARLMKRYDDIPNWWFYILLAASMAVSMVLCTVFKEEVQLPWWGLLVACAMAFIFTLPISFITATTNTMKDTTNRWYSISVKQVIPVAKEICEAIHSTLSAAQDCNDRTFIPAPLHRRHTIPNLLD
ncbi:Oligopeptide transporter 4 [Hordeum vulgare]|nr:Oligopeptide transporter 4 [Hordeum vulgare]